MSNPVETFFSAWAMTDAEARRAAISASMQDSAGYCDPRSGELISGHGPISDYVGAFSANAPGWSATVVKSDAVGGMVRATVSFGGPGPDGADIQQLGQYFVEIQDDQITRMTGFVGTGVPD